MESISGNTTLYLAQVAVEYQVVLSPAKAPHDPPVLEGVSPQSQKKSQSCFYFFWPLGVIAAQIQTQAGDFQWPHVIAQRGLF